jgi:hypothetical protein
LLSDQPLEPAVFVFQGLEPRRLAWLETTIFLLPPVESLLTDAVLATERRRRGTRLVLFQDADESAPA